MMYFRFPIALMVAGASMASCAKGAASRDPEADKAAIRAVITRAGEATRAGDAAAWTALFADGAVYMRPGGPEISTRASLQEFASLYLGQYYSRTEVTPVEVEVFGDWGFA